MQLLWKEGASYHSHFRDRQTKVWWQLSSCARVPAGQWGAGDRSERERKCRQG